MGPRVALPQRRAGRVLAGWCGGVRLDARAMRERAANTFRRAWDHSGVHLTTPTYLNALKRSEPSRNGSSRWAHPSRFVLLAAYAASALAAWPATSLAQGSLTVYASFPHVGGVATQSQHVVRGARMALEDHAGRAGGLPVTLRSLNDGSSAIGRWDPSRTARNATVAAETLSRSPTWGSSIQAPPRYPCRLRIRPGCFRCPHPIPMIR
jgi:hypothetical protein